MPSKKDLTGQRFGKLIVLSDTDKRDSSGGIIWKCKCDCGNIKFISTANLTSKKGTKSCGCVGKKKKEDLTKNKYGKLTPIKFSHNVGNKIYWMCKCDCGNIAYVRADHLKSNRITSCGCDTTSNGEKIIISILNKNSIYFERQKSFKECKYKKELPFDFYINNYYLLEFDGPQHFQPCDFFGGENNLNIQHKRDEIKNQWCKKNNIPLIRIPYTKLNTLCLEDLLLEITTFRVV